MEHLAWNTKFVAALAIALLIPAWPGTTGPAGSASAGASDGNVMENVSIATPAFLQLNLWWDDAAARQTALDLDDFRIWITDSVGLREIHENPIPVMPSEIVRVRIYGKSGGYSGNDIMSDLNYTSGAAGSYRVIAIGFDTNELATQSIFVPVRVEFRPYDSRTGAGFAVEQFNITVQFQDQDLGSCSPGCYTAGPETPIALGHINTYFGLNMTVRARDYFGNLLYNETRVLRFDNATYCIPVIEPEYAGQCGLMADAFYIWDIPLSVHSFKTFNQKPDQFIKVKLFWNGSGAGEEVFAPNSGLFPEWWNNAYTYRQRLRVNTSSTSVFTNYSLNLSLLASSLAGKMQGDYRDLRVLYWNGSAWTELARAYDGSNLYWPAQGPSPLPDTPANGSWHFDDGTGTSATDSSGNGGTGTLQNGPTWVTDRYGTQYAVSLDGSNDYVSVAHSTATNVVTSAITLEAWIHPTAVTGARQVISKAVGVAAGDRKYGLYLNGGNLGFEVRTSSGTVDMGDTSSIAANAWTHIAGTYDGTNMRWYVNGVQTKITGQTGAIVSNTQDLQIGRFPTGVSFFQGYIGDVRLYDYARSAAEIACDARVAGCVAINPSTTNRDYFIYYGNPLAGAPPSYRTYRQDVLSESSVRGYWTLDEASGSTAVDVSGNNNNGAVTGTVIINGKVVLARDFDGVDDRIDTGTGASRNNDFTIEAWVRVAGSFTHAAQGVVQWGDETAGERRALILWNGGAGDLRAYFSGFGAPANVQGDSKMNTGTWRHVAVTLTSGNVASVYVDGILENSGSVTLAAYANNVVLVGDTGTAGEDYEGDADEVAIYHGVLSQATIVSHFEKGIAQNTSAAVSLDSSNGFEWYQSPTETVERFLNPGYYEVQIITDNRTGVQSRANLGMNITEANYLMVEGTNITRFIGDFESIYSQTQIITSAFRPDVIEYGELLPSAPSQIKFMNAPEETFGIDPRSILEGSAVYIGAAGTNVTSFMPDIDQEADAIALLNFTTVKQDQFVFSGSEPALTHVWINYTSNGTNIWENATLPPVVTLAGIQGDVYVVTNRTVQTTRISSFHTTWDFTVGYQATPRKYFVTLALNNSMNRSIYEPYWFVAFPEGKTIDLTTAAIKDIDNDVWLTQGQQFTVTAAGYYMTFAQLNASTRRSFYFEYFDANASDDQTTPVITVNEITHSGYVGDNAYWSGTAAWSNPDGRSYTGELVIKLRCSECSKAKLDTLIVVDETRRITLDESQFFTEDGQVKITQAGVGEVVIGGARQYRVYFKMELEPSTEDLSFFQPILGIFSLAVLAVMLILVSIMGIATAPVRYAGKPQTEVRKSQGAWAAVLTGTTAVFVVMWILRAQQVAV